MANIMTKRGSQDNMVTYEHICDTRSDLANIDSAYVTLGSVALVLKGEDGLEVYMASSTKEWEPLILGGSAGGGGEAGSGFTIHVCTNAEIDNNGFPNIAVPDPATIYFVPNEGNVAGNIYKEYVYVNSAWEKFGDFVDNSQVTNAVNAWLTAHPEATTTVADGAVTAAKLGNDIKSNVLSIPVLKDYIAPSEASSTASTGHAVDTYLIYDDNLYRVTTAISTGDTLTPGTNLTRVSSLSYATYLLKRFAEITLVGRIDSLESVLAQPYTVGDNYDAGEYVFYNHNLYECKYGVQNAGEFNASQWTEITETADILNYLRSRISTVQQLALQANDGYRHAMAMTAPAFSATQAYSAGDSVTYNEVLYTFTADHAAGAWIGTDATAVPGGVTGKVAELKRK